MHILIIPGSLRKGSFNRMLAEEAARMLLEGVTHELFELDSIPLYSHDTEQAGFPPAVSQFRDKIGSADGVLIATPEYNYSIPGVLKNALDWASRPPDQPFNLKPVAMLGAGGAMGTVRAQLHLRDVFLYLNSRVLGKPEIYVTQASTKFSPEGKLTDERSLDQLQKFVKAFVEMI